MPFVRSKLSACLESPSRAFSIHLYRRFIGASRAGWRGWRASRQCCRMGSTPHTIGRNALSRLFRFAKLQLLLGRHCRLEFSAYIRRRHETPKGLMNEAAKMSVSAGRVRCASSSLWTFSLPQAPFPQSRIMAPDSCGKMSSVACSSSSGEAPNWASGGSVKDWPARSPTSPLPSCMTTAIWPELTVQSSLVAIARSIAVMSHQPKRRAGRRMGQDSSQPSSPPPALASSSLKRAPVEISLDTAGPRPEVP